MNDIREFLNLKGIALDSKAVHDWVNADPAFVDYVLQHHQDFDYQHLRCAMQMLQNTNREDVRDFYLDYVNHTVTGYRLLAQGSLELQHQRGWIEHLPAWA